MSDRNVVGFGIVAVLLYALLGGGPGMSTPSGAAADSAAIVASDYEGSATRLLEDYFHTSSIDAVHCDSTRSPGKCEADVMIGILPDPKATAIDWGFDAYLEAVRRGFEAAGYVADRWYLPWTGASPDSSTGVAGAMLFRSDANAARLRMLLIVGEQPTTGVDLPAFEAALEEHHALATRLTGLGWSIARPNTVRIIGPTFSGSIPSIARALLAWSDTIRAAAVFDIVTGSATGTANREILESLNARFARRTSGEGSFVRYRATVSDDATLLEQLCDVLIAGYGYRPGQIAILRETGTAYSAAFTGRSEMEAARRTSSVEGDRGTGGATVEVPESTEEAADDPDPPPSASTCSPGSREAAGARPTEERAGAVPGSVAEGEEPHTHADGAEPHPHDEAIEAETPAERTEPADTPAASPASDDHDGHDHDHKHHQSEDTAIVEIPFPMNIAGLRAQQTEVQSGGETRPLFTNPALVSLTLQDQRQRRDQPLTLSPLTPPTQELLLEEITSTLRSREVRAVGIVATDVRDKLFLGQFLRRRLDGAQLFTTESNTLLLRSPLGVAMRGMLVATTYPLVLSSEWWFDPRGPRIAFASEAAAGVYNATLVHLRNEFAVPPPLAGGARWDDGAPDGYGVPSWVTVVGDRSFLPLRVDAATEARFVHVAAPDRPSLIALIALALTAGVLFLVTRSFLRLRRDGDTADRQPHSDEGMLRAHRGIYHLVATVAIGGAFIPAVAILRGPQIVEEIGEGGSLLQHPADVIAVLVTVWWFVLLAMTLALAIVRLARVARDRFARSETETEVRYAAPAVFLLFSFAYLVLIGWFAAEASFTTPAQGALLRYRALQISSAFSPLVPLIVFAGFCAAWALWHARRVRLLGAFCPIEEVALRRAADGKDAGRGARATRRQVDGGLPFERVHHVREILRDTFPPDDRGRVLMLVAFATLLIIALGSRFTGSAELVVDGRSAGGQWFRSPFDGLLFLALATSYFVLIWNLHRLFVVWHELHRALVSFAASPLRTGLTRVMKRVRECVRPGVLNDETRIALDLESDRLWRVLQEGTPRDAKAACVLTEKKFKSTRNADDPVAIDALSDCLATHWQENAGTEADDGKDPWIVAATDLLAVKVAEYATRVRRYIIEMTSLLLITMLVLNGLLVSYWFVSRPEFRLVFIGLLVLAIAAILIVLTEMNRDVVLSTVSGTEPGVVNWNPRFVMSILLFVIVPILATLSADVPSVRNAIFFWLEPAMRTTMGM